MERNVFTVPEPDWDLSPFTGLTREGWLEAGRHLLSGLFEGLPGKEAPPLARRTEFEITYPHKGAGREQLLREQKAEIFEGLCRTFLVGSLLIRENEEETIAGISLRDYYASHILRCTVCPEDAEYVGTYEEMQELSGRRDPYACFQQTVETCALVLGLFACREQIWERYTREERDALAAFLSGYAHAPTVPQNWRFFNLLVLAFLDREGYPIHEEVMEEHARQILAYYAGDGWYRDGQNFDYYGCWAFQAYAPLWCLWYGWEKRPGMARRFYAISREFMRTYPLFFGRGGEVNLWGRSGIYRNAAAAPLGTFFLYGGEEEQEKEKREGEEKQEKEKLPSPGWCRRICSGALLQFFTREDFLSEGVPSLGFYGLFPPQVQGYSCAESPYWLGKAFLCLLLPKDHPFWTEREEEGSWRGLGERVLTAFLPGPGLSVSCHGESGETVLRTGKVVKDVGDLSSLDTYGKLSYNTAFPWEATPAGVLTGEEEPVASQAYLYSSPCTGVLWPNATLWAGEREGVLYRRQFFSYTTREETHWTQAMNLADFPVKNGILRVDKPRIMKWPMEVTLGSYGFPEGEEIEILSGEEEEGRFLQILGRDARGRERAMALSVFGGWEEVKSLKRRGTNPEAPSSVLLYARTSYTGLYDGRRFPLLLSLVLTREERRPFTREELFPVREIRYEDEEGPGSFGEILLFLRDGSRRRVCFDGIEGRLEL